MPEKTLARVFTEVGYIVQEDGCLPRVIMCEKDDWPDVVGSINHDIQADTEFVGDDGSACVVGSDPTKEAMKALAATITDRSGGNLFLEIMPE